MAIIETISQNPKMFALALGGGILPALLWLKFWMKEDSDDPEPRGMSIAFCFVLGMGMVMLAIPIEKYIQANLSDHKAVITLWAATEELLKYFIVMLAVSKTRYINDPLDYAMYFITGALGFAALENALFLLHPLSNGDTVVSLLTGNLRFLGATLLHSTATGFIGIMLGLAYFENRAVQKIYLFFGLITAICLHAVFNFFIMDTGKADYLKIFGFLWVATIITMLLFEKLRRMSGRS